MKRLIILIGFAAFVAGGHTAFSNSVAVGNTGGVQYGANDKSSDISTLSTSKSTYYSLRPGVAQGHQIAPPAQVVAPTHRAAGVIHNPAAFWPAIPFSFCPVRARNP